MGVLQALEGIKLLSRPVEGVETRTTMTVFSAFSETRFRTLKMRGRRAACVACGEPADAAEKITREAMEEGLVDHMAFCRGRGGVGVLAEGERVGVGEYWNVRGEGRRHVLLDVRDSTQFGICSLEGSLSM